MFFDTYKTENKTYVTNNCYEIKKELKSAYAAKEFHKFCCGYCGKDIEMNHSVEFFLHDQCTKSLCGGFKFNEVYRTKCCRKTFAVDNMYLLSRGDGSQAYFVDSFSHDKMGFDLFFHVVYYEIKRVEYDLSNKKRNTVEGEFSCASYKTPEFVFDDMGRISHFI